MLWLLTLTACHPPASPVASAVPQVRYRPTDPPGEEARWLVEAIPGGQWDTGLAAAVESLVLAVREPSARLTLEATSLAAARAGFPGQARFARLLNGGALPAELVDQILLSAGEVGVDVALARRSWGDGLTLWVVGYAPHYADIDPLPVALDLDGSLALRMDLRTVDKAESRLFLASPEGPVEEISIRSGVARWLERFHVPGVYRLEVVTGEQSASRVALLFSVFVDAEPPPIPPLTAADSPPINPHLAEQALYGMVNELRADRGLPALKRFEKFEGVAREHAALMGANGVIAHRIPGVTEGVPARAAALYHPRAYHHENVAAAASAEEAMALVVDSPGHLKALLCTSCTHISIGAAIEPVLDRRPRLFVTWEVLEFPQGEPRRIQDYNR